MPITPWCQPLSATTITLFLLSSFCVIISSARSKIFCSSAFLRIFSLSRVLAISSAFDLLSHIKSSTAISALARRPAALSRGAMPKLTEVLVMSQASIFASFKSDKRPIFFVSFNFSSPYFAINLFSPQSSAKSAIVPIAQNGT